MSTPNPTPDSKPPAAPTIPTIVADADLMREIQMLKGELEIKNKQLKQAIDVVQRANDEKKAKDDAEKLRLIDSILIDSKYSKDDLKDKTLPELHTIRTTIDKSLEKTFASVAAELDEAKKHKIYGIDYWDSKAQEWRMK